MELLITSTTNDNMLRHLMWKYDVTIGELADATGISRTSIKNFFHGNVSLKIESDMWAAMYCLKGDEIGLQNFTNYLDQYYSKRHLDTVNMCARAKRLWAQ